MFLGPVSDPTTYEWQVCDLLHDTFIRWTQTQIDTYINQARVQLVQDQGCLRVLQQSFVTQAVESYQYGVVCGASILTGGAGYSTPTVAFTGGGGVGAAATLGVTNGAITSITFSSFGGGYTSAPIATITPAGLGGSIQVGIISALTYDVLAAALYWGTVRYQLTWSPFREFSAWVRPYQATAYQRQPAAWSLYSNQVYVGPPPDQTYAIEFDTVILPTYFAVGDISTPEVIPSLFTPAVPFYAAYLAKRNSRNFGEAESFLQDYRRKAQELAGAYVGRVRDPYQAR